MIYFDVLYIVPFYFITGIYPTFFNCIMDSKILRLTLCCFVGVLSGLGLGFTYMVSRAIITEWFDKNLGVASGIASTGAGFGQLALAPIIAILIVKLGIMFAFAKNTRQKKSFQFSPKSGF